MSEISVTPDMYTPSVDDNGNYVDRVSSTHSMNKGLQCPCGSETVFKTHATFMSHTKTKRHQKWIETLNLNKQNYFTENIRLNDVIKHQQHLIARMEKNLCVKSMTIDLLTQQIQNGLEQSNPETNLLDFD